jgi:hypothetical protein
VGVALVVQRRPVALLASCLLALLALLVVLAQLFLPALAARRVRDRVARYGTVSSVSVSAFPAIKLLWGHADSVSVRARALSAPASRIASLLWEAHDAANMTLTAATATVTAVPELAQGLTVSDLRMEKHGSAIVASATLTQQQLDEALPSGFRIEPLASERGEVEARASGGLFGVQASITALVRPFEGRLVAEPRGFPFAALATVTLFSDPHLKVRSVGVRALQGRPLSYGLSLSATLV